MMPLSKVCHQSQFFFGIKEPNNSMIFFKFSSKLSSCDPVKESRLTMRIWIFFTLTALCIRVSNGTGQRNFSGQRDSQNFFVPGQRDNGTEVPLLSRDKGTTGQAQNLAKGRDGPGQPKPGTGRAGTAKIRDGTRDKTGQSRKGCSKTV